MSTLFQGIFMKKCNRCQETKPFNEFHKNKVFQDGYAHYCKLCRSEYNKKDSRRKEYDKEYRSNNKDQLKQCKKNYYENNKEDISLRMKQWYQDTKEKRNTYYRERRQKNINVRIKDNCSRRINGAIKNSKSNKTLDLVGCSVDFLKLHLESQFKEDMAWSNYGKWHIDHIKPCASFDLTDIEQQKICFHYTNLQPLWAIDNIKKSNK